MGTAIVDFLCPLCDNEEGYEFLNARRGTLSRYCLECGYSEYADYKLSEDGSLMKIDEDEELDYDNIQIERQYIINPYREDNPQPCRPEGINSFLKRFREKANAKKKAEQLIQKLLEFKSIDKS